MNKESYVEIREIRIEDLAADEREWLLDLYHHIFQEPIPPERFKVRTSDSGGTQIFGGIILLQSLIEKPVFSRISQLLRSETYDSSILHQEDECESPRAFIDLPIIGWLISLFPAEKNSKEFVKATLDIIEHVTILRDLPRNSGYPSKVTFNALRPDWNDEKIFLFMLYLIYEEIIKYDWQRLHEMYLNDIWVSWITKKDDLQLVFHRNAKKIWELHQQEMNLFSRIQDQKYKALLLDEMRVLELLELHQYWKDACIKMGSILEFLLTEWLEDRVKNSTPPTHHIDRKAFFDTKLSFTIKQLQGKDYGIGSYADWVIVKAIIKEYRNFVHLQEYIYP